MTPTKKGFLIFSDDLKLYGKYEPMTVDSLIWFILSTVISEWRSNWNRAVRNSSREERKSTLILKSAETLNPRNYRTTTLLTIHIPITAIISKRIIEHLEDNNLFAEKKDCKNGRYWCKDQLMINKDLNEDSRNKKDRLSTCFR